MRRTRPIPRRRYGPRGGAHALALALSALAAGGAGAQVASLRGTTSPSYGSANPTDINPALPGPGLTDADTAQPTMPQRPGASDPRRPGTRAPLVRRPASKRTRVPTAGTVRADVHAAIADPKTAPDIQPPQTGIPDPVLPPVPPVKKKPPEDDPYASLGFRAGNIMFYPAIGESLGYDSNPNRIDGLLRKGSFVSQTEAELRVQSDWSRHELTGFLRGAYNDYPDVKEANRPEGAGRLGLRLDITRDTIVDTEVHYQLDTERFGSPDLNVITRERPVVNTEGGSIGLTEKFNRLAVTLRGTIDRTDYANATLGDGSLLDQSDRAFTQYGGALRLAYEFNPGLVPFVEGLGDERSYDLRTDFAGYQRSSNGIGGRVGTTFELTRLVTGEFSVGAIQRYYDDRRLGSLTSPLVNGALTWAVTPLTTVRLNGQVTVDETTVVGSNGVIASRASLEIAHALLRNLTITPGISIFENDYKGVTITEHGFSASLKAEYKLTRAVAIRASYIHEELKSNLPGNDYTANVMLVGLRFQP